MILFGPSSKGGVNPRHNRTDRVINNEPGRRGMGDLPAAVGESRAFLNELEL